MLGENTPYIVTPPHPMSAYLGTVLYKAVKTDFQGCTKSGVMWKICLESGSSAHAMLHLYARNSTTTLKSTAFTFCPVHVLLLNFEEEIGTKIIVSGDTILSYIPSWLFKRDEDDGVLQSDLITVGIQTNSRIRLLHNSIHLIFDDIDILTFTGIDSCTKDSVKLT